MPKAQGTARKSISAAIFILLEVAALNMLSRSSVMQNIWMNRASHRTMAALWSRGESIRNYFYLGIQNEELAQENLELRRKLAYYTDYRLEHMRDSVARRRASADFDYIPADIIKMSRNTQHNYIIINRGTADGIHPQSGIITGKGVVGIIDAVDEHYSYGLSLMNTNVRVSARVGKEGVVAPLVWDGIHTNRALMKELPIHSKVTPGDTIWTSGFSSIFPADIPLGVAGKTTTVSGSTNTVEVTLFQDFAAPRYVTVTSNRGMKAIQNLERVEEDAKKK